MRRWSRRRWLMVGFALLPFALAGLLTAEWFRVQRRIDSLLRSTRLQGLVPGASWWEWPAVELSPSAERQVHEIAQALDVRLLPPHAHRRHVLAALLQRELERQVAAGPSRVSADELASFLQVREPELERLTRALTEGVGGGDGSWPEVAQNGHLELQGLLLLRASEGLTDGDTARATRSLVAAWNLRDAFFSRFGRRQARISRRELVVSLQLLRRLPLVETAWLHRFDRSSPWEAQLGLLKGEVRTGLHYLTAPARQRTQVGAPGLSSLQAALWTGPPGAGRLGRLRTAYQNRCFLAQTERALGQLTELRRRTPCGVDLLALAREDWQPLERTPACPLVLVGFSSTGLAEALSLQAHVDLSQIALLTRRYCDEEDGRAGLERCVRQVFQSATCPDDWTLRRGAEGGWEVAHAHPEWLVPLPLATSLPIDRPLPLE